jgi:hypothetical protein
MADAEDAAVLDQERTGRDATIDLATRHAGREGLLPRHHTMLPAGDSADYLRRCPDFATHTVA